MATNIIIVIIVTSLATYLSRFLGVISAEKIKETSKMFRWFNCLAYSTLAALIARIVIFPLGSLSEIDYLVNHEWARTAEDILFRRTKLGLYFDEHMKNELDAYLKQ